MKSKQNYRVCDFALTDTGIIGKIIDIESTHIILKLRRKRRFAHVPKGSIERVARSEKDLGTSANWLDKE